MQSHPRDEPQAEIHSLTRLLRCNGLQSPNAKFQLTIRTVLFLTLLVGLSLAYLNTFNRMRRAETELRRLRSEVGYLEPVAADQVAAIRVPSTTQLEWKARISVPATPAYRLAYSAVWRESTLKPDWFSAQSLPPGESTVTVQIIKDLRDDRWKMAIMVQHAGGVARMATALPDEISSVFRGSHDVISGGVGREPLTLPAGDTIHLFDERYFSGDQLLLYGDRAPQSDLIGIFADLQPDTNPL